MAAKKSSYEAIKKGGDPRKDSSGGGNWLKLESGQMADVVALVGIDDIIACEQCAIWLDEGNSPVWVYTGPEDPSHDLKVDRRYRAYLPVLAILGNEIQVWSMGKSSHMQLLDIADAGGDLKGMELRIKRTGSGLATRYSIVPKGMRRDVDDIEEVDVIAMLGPITPDEVKEMLAKKLNKESYEEVVATYRGKKARSTAMGKRAKAEAEEESIDDIELV